MSWGASRARVVWGLPIVPPPLGGGELVAVEFEEVVGGGEEAPFGSDGGSASSEETVGASVCLDLAEDGFDHALAFEVELFAVLGCEHASGEVVEPAASAGSGFFAAVGVG